MTSKLLKRIIIAVIVIVIALTHHNTRAGLVPHHEPKHEPQHHQHHKATSYMHFHGPVEGPEYEVKIPYFESNHHHHHHHHQQQEHNHLHQPSYVMDYVAHPKYEYSYGVEDWHTGDFHSQKESRDGSSVTGEYSVAEPGGRLRIVSYRADKDGFHAHVHTSGKNDHSSGTYGYDHNLPQLNVESSSHIEQQYHQDDQHQFSTRHEEASSGVYL